MSLMKGGGLEASCSPPWTSLALSSLAAGEGSCCKLCNCCLTLNCGIVVAAAPLETCPASASKKAFGSRKRKKKKRERKGGGLYCVLYLFADLLNFKNCQPRGQVRAHGRRIPLGVETPRPPFHTQPHKVS